MRNFVCLALALAVLTGCAVTPIKPEVAQNLRTGKIAAALCLQDKSITYEEMVYKVLWNETRKQKSTFEGFWDVDEDLGNVLAEEMVKQNLNTVPIKSVLAENDSYEAFAQAVSKARWVDDKNREPLALNQDLVTRLKDSDIDYIVAIRSGHFYLSTTSMNSSGPMYLASQLIVYDVNNAEEVYDRNYFIMGNIKWGKSVRNIESNNLTLLKEASRGWIRDTTKKDLPVALGLRK